MGKGDTRTCQPLMITHATDITIQFVIRGASSCILLHLDNITAFAEGVVEGEGVSNSIQSHEGLSKAEVEWRTKGGLQTRLKLSHQLFLTAFQLFLPIRRVILNHISCARARFLALLVFLIVRGIFCSHCRTYRTCFSSGSFLQASSSKSSIFHCSAEYQSGLQIED